MSLFGRRGKTTGATPQGADFLLTRSAPERPSEYRGAEIVENFAILRWDTDHGGVGLAYSLKSGETHPSRFIKALRRHYGDYLFNRFASVVAVQHSFDMDGPELDAVDVYRKDEESEPYHPTWRQVAAIFGTKVPFWHPTLRDRDAILEWRPGAPPAIVPAFDREMPAGAFTILAADEPDGSQVAEVCLWLARTVRYRATADAEEFFEFVARETENVMEWWTLGAVPAKIQRPAPEPLPDVIRRAGWAQIVGRRDTLAAEVAHLSRNWDSGAAWPAGAIDRIYPVRCPTAATWAARLVPPPTDQPPTVLERELLASDGSWPGDRSDLLIDPETQLPAIYRKKDTEKEYIQASVPQQLPTTAPLKSVILSTDTVWIRTEDGGLWIAPRHPSLGLSWGYRGSGPATLATLLGRLLEDILALPVGPQEFMQPEPPGLLRLIEGTEQEASTTYTREQLETARDEA
jgi:hypothetical protein